MRQTTTPVQEKNAGTRQRNPSRWMVTTGTTYRTSATVGRVATGRSIEVGFGGAGGKGVMVEMGWLSGGGEAEWPPRSLRRG